MKVLTIIGTRPEIIKLSRVIAELDKHIDHILVHTGQNFDYELNEIFFNDLEIRKPDYFLDAVGGSVAETIGNIISKSDKVLEMEKPDAILLLGDTNSCLSAISAKRRKIPIFHMEAGNRCFDQRVPEEINRKIVDHISDINMTYTEHARRYLLDEGLKPDMVIKTGSPMMEVLEYYSSKIDSSTILTDLNLIHKEYFIVSLHREENVDNDENFNSLLNSLTALIEKFNYPVIVSTHPRTRKRIDSISENKLDSRIKFLKPLGFFDYITLQKNAACVVSDSGTITEESSILGFPAVTIRQMHERPEGMDEGTLIMCGLKDDSILLSLEIVMEQFHKQGFRSRIVPDYNVGIVSQKVIRIILSYVDYINRVVWKK